MASRSKESHAQYVKEFEEAVQSCSPHTRVVHPMSEHMYDPYNATGPPIFQVISNLSCVSCNSVIYNARDEPIRACKTLAGVEEIRYTLQTATFGQPSATENGDYDYTRSGNPTRRLFEDHVAMMEVLHAHYSCTARFSSSSPLLLLSPFDVSHS